MAGALALSLTGTTFQLQWTHSVEKVGWRETWQIEDGLLHLRIAAVKGSGAGMEPGPDAVLTQGWWVWTPDIPPQHELVLAASGKTGSGWTICYELRCHSIGRAESAPIRLWPCP